MRVMHLHKSVYSITTQVNQINKVGTDIFIILSYERKSKLEEKQECMEHSPDECVNPRFKAVSLIPKELN